MLHVLTHMFVSRWRLAPAADEELARSNTIQKTVSSFGRSFTLTGKKKNKAPESLPATSVKEDEEEGEEEDEEEEVFNWVSHMRPRSIVDAFFPRSRVRESVR